MRIFLLSIFIFVVGIGSACTTFSFTDKTGHIVFGRNFDFPVGKGHIEINKRNMRKTAFVRPPEKALEWVSEYGSITFNQIGKEFPYGGMNEAGLVIEQMWLQDVQYPEPDSRYALSALQWIQYQLDNAATVEEVIASDTMIRIATDDVAKLHFLIADANGNVASIEFLNGQMVVHTGKDFPFPVLANCTYDTSLDYKKSVDRKENRQFNPWTENSSGRFVKAAAMIENYDPGKSIIDYSFDILDSVAQPGSTQWSIVYDITNRLIRFKTKENSTVRTLVLRSFDFSCDGPDIFTGISETISGKSSFREYSYRANYELQKYVVTHVDFLKNTVPEEAIIATAKYPESVVCEND